MPADVLPPLQRLSALGQSVWLDSAAGTCRS